MRLLKPGDLCPCCGRPIPAGLSDETMLLLSYIGMTTTRKEALDGGESTARDVQGMRTGLECVSEGDPSTGRVSVPDLPAQVLGEVGHAR